MQKKTIGLIISSLENAGGMERSVTQFANYLSKKDDYKVLIICLVHSNLFYKLNENVELIIPNQRFRSKNRIKYLVNISVHLNRSVSNNNVDLIISFGEKYNLFVLTILLFRSVKIFISDRCSPTAKVSLLYYWYRKFIYLRANSIISQTQTAKEYILKNTINNKVEVIPNLVKRFEEIIVKNNREKIILNVGRLDKLKQQDVLIRMYYEIGDYNWKLVILGEGPERKNLEILISTLGLKEYVFLEGARFDLENYFTKASIFAFTSRSEGFPNSLAEAFLFPLACISFDCIAGPSDIINDGENGFLVRLDDTEDFKRKLSLLMKEESIRSKFEFNAIKEREKYQENYIGEVLDILIKKAIS